MKSVLVTGACGGMGSEIALILAGRGYKVWAAVRERGLDEFRRRRQQAGVAIDEIPLDITDDASIEAAFRQIESGPPLTGVINCAGVTSRCCFEEFPEERIRQIFEVNTFGTMKVVRRSLPLLRRNQGGRIVIITSIGGRIGNIGVAPYIASKFALEGFGESLYLEMLPFNVHVTLVEPGITRTQIWRDERILAQAREERSPYRKIFWGAEELAVKALQSAENRPEDIARAIAKLMEDTKPRLRLVVGRRASAVLSLRRVLPERMFEKFYFGSLLRLVNRAARSTPIQG